MMKFPPMLCLLPALLVTPAPAIEPGDSRDDVVYELGRPNGVYVYDEAEVLTYDRGEVRLEEGLVTEVNLVSETEAAEEQRRRVAAAGRAREEARQAQDRHTAEGKALRDTTSADEAFLALPPEEQLAFWDDFSRRYPGVALPEGISEARARYRKQQEEEAAKVAAEKATPSEPEPVLSSRKRRKEARRVDPSKPVETRPWTPPYRRLGGNLEPE